MTFQELEYFLTVYEEKNITAAAKKLSITQQSLSKYIQRMERAYGVALFKRRPVFLPTRAGECLAESSRSMLRLKKEIDAELSDIALQEGGRMTFGMSAYLACEMLPDLLEKFCPAHPKVSLQIVSGHSNFTEEKTIDGKLGLV